ncbi:hypothetical protein ISS03_01970 [Patescibacteria group bacterium]|nr:hypothetical protein [Patescibacteria group bacterium]
MHNHTTLALKALGNFFIELLYFPIWWYSFGALSLIKKQITFLHNREKSLVILVWIKNIFKPMYEQHDAIRYILSFFARIFQIILRVSYFIILLIASFSIISIWLALPILVVLGIIYQIS